MYWPGVNWRRGRLTLFYSLKLCAAERGGPGGLPLENLISILIKLYTINFKLKLYNFGLKFSLGVLSGGTNDPHVNSTTMDPIEAALAALSLQLKPNYTQTAKEYGVE